MVGNILSSSLSPAPPSPIPVRPQEVQQRTVQTLPDELISHITTYLEEGLYQQALIFLTNLMNSGTSGNSPVFCPPGYLLSFIVTLSLHPRFTIHASTLEKLRVSTTATAYLSSLLAIVGPVAGPFKEAYTFLAHNYLRNGRAVINRDTADSSEESSGEVLESDLAKSQGFFNRADNFWSALGWAFTCSVLHARRWETYSIWCHHMLDLLISDIHLRESETEDWFPDTLLVQYIGSNPSTSQIKRIIRAIFAEGRGSEFTEIWKDETVRKRKKATARKARVKLDIEAGQLGDYADATSSSGEDDDEDTAPAEESFPTLGPPESVTLRMRSLALLATYALITAETVIPLEDLYTLLSAEIRPLPLQTLIPLLSPQNLSFFPSDSGTGLVVHLASAYSRVRPGGDELSWSTLETEYAPATTAGSVVGDNGKLTLCIEILIRVARRELGDSPLHGLKLDTLQGAAARFWQAFEDGCQLRLEQARHSKRGRVGEAGSQFNFEEMRAFEISWLRGARIRMALLLGAKI